jgi:polysaccharide biosynthesis transport protein
MDVVYLFRIFFRKKWIIIASALLAAIITYFLTSKTPKTYRSTSQISTGYTISDNIKIGNENFDMYEADIKFNNAITTITSPSVISFLSYALMIHDLESKTPFRQLSEKETSSAIYKSVNKDSAKKMFREKLESMSLLSSFKNDEKQLLEFQTLYKYDYKTLGSKLNVTRLQRTDYIQAEHFSENPELSAFVVNNLYNQFIRYYKSVRGTISQESVDTLRNIMEKKKQDLDFKNSLLRGDAAVDVGMQNTSNYDLISAFEQSLIDEKNKLSDNMASLQKVNLRLSTAPSSTKPATSTSAANNEEVLTLRKSMNEAYTAYLNGGSSDKNLLARYNQLKLEYQTKVANLNRDNPQQQQGTAKIPETREELLLKKSELEIDIQTCNSNITSLQSKISSLKGNIYSGASKGATIQTLTKEADQANIEYLQAKQKYNDAIDMSSNATNNFRQILMGQPAIAPEPSKRLLLTGLAGASALMVALLVITVLIYLDSSLKTPGSFSKVVNLKLISTVNFLNFKNKPLNEIVAKREIEDGERGKSKNNFFRESLRKLRYEIEASGKHIILFASTKKGQGKTTLVMGLSYILSLSKKKILIIDTNFCNNDLTVEMGGQPILEKLNFDASGNSSVIEQILKNAKATDSENIFIIGSEGGDYTPSEVLPKNNILHHLHELKSEFDYIFLEGPPLNDFSDAKELSQYVEGVVGVYSATTEIKQMDKEAITYFKSLKDKYIGSILNKVDSKNMDMS